MLKLVDYGLIIEAISLFNNTGRPTTVRHITVDIESIRIGIYVYKKVDMEADVKNMAKYHVPNALYEDYMHILNKYFD
jgi:hypothetical protein